MLRVWFDNAAEALQKRKQMELELSREAAEGLADTQWAQHKHTTQLGGQKGISSFSLLFFPRTEGSLEN